MSFAEFARLVKGETLVNERVHRNDGYKTNAVGFCFTDVEPERSIRYLSGNVDADVCIKALIDEELLTKCFGIYVGGRRTEYCLRSYSLDDITLLGYTFAYRNIPGRKATQQMLAAFGFHSKQSATRL